MRLLVRCDADSTLGLGHAGRALALAEELTRRLGVRAHFVSRATPLLETFLEGHDVDLRPVTGEGYAVDDVLAAADGETFLVSDIYQLTDDDLDALAAAGIRHLVVDDFARLDRWNCDAIVNPNVGARVDAYRTQAVVGAGGAYALLRREVREAALRPRSVRTHADRVLVCLGGGDWADEATPLLAALAGLPAEVRATVDQAALPAGVHAVPRASLVEQLAWADVGVLSGGVVKYEAAATGLPMLLVAAVEHQRGVAEAFAGLGGGEYLGPLASVDPGMVADRVRTLLADPGARAERAAGERRLVDGRGVERAADLLLGARDG